MTARRVPGKVVYVGTMEEIFPAGPGQELVRENCTGCHNDGNAWRNMKTKEDFVHGIERMTETGPSSFPNVLALGRTALSAKQKDIMADYLAKNFGAGATVRRLRVDPLGDHGLEPGRESGQQDGAEDDQQDLQTVAFEPVRDVADP